MSRNVKHGVGRSKRRALARKQNGNQSTKHEWAPQQYKCLTLSVAPVPHWDFDHDLWYAGDFYATAKAMKEHTDELMAGFIPTRRSKVNGSTKQWLIYRHPRSDKCLCITKMDFRETDTGIMMACEISKWASGKPFCWGRERFQCLLQDPEFLTKYDRAVIGNFEDLLGGRQHHG